MKKINILILSIFFQLAVTAQSQMSGLRADSRNNAIELTWTAATEAGMARHEIERSANGSSFSIVGAINAQNNNSAFRYSFLDAAPVQGLNYYRIRSTSNRGDVSFSNVLTVDMSMYKPEVKVLGNPVRNGVVNLQVNNLEKGKYIISLYNSVGQQVFNYSFDHPGGSSTRLMNLPAVIGKGNHVLLMTDGINRFNQQVMIM
jgi:hypothetical protein